jgi:nitrogen fixation NifU-like protein
MDDFYKEYILDHYRNPRNFGHLERRCDRRGSQPAVRRHDQDGARKLDGDGRVDDVKFSGKGCAISQASASMLTESIKGMKLEDVARLSQESCSRTSASASARRA